MSLDVYVCVFVYYIVCVHFIKNSISELQNVPVFIKDKI